GKPGRPPQPVQEPPPAVGDGQGGTKQRPGRLPALISRVCCGSRRLERGELSSRTRLLACLPLTLRHALAPLVRTRWGCGTERTPMRRRVVLWQAVDHFARPHMPRDGSSPRGAITPLAWPLDLRTMCGHCANC